MIRLIQRRLIVPRGDTGTFSIPVLAGKDNGDASVFTIFDPLTHRKVFEKVMELSDGVLTMDLTHGDTVNLPVGQYVWDIKFYTDAVFDQDGKVASGTEVDSYYAAFQLPICEIRETGDNLLLADDAPDARLASDQINYLDLVRGQVQEYAEGAANSAAEADTSATNAENSASAAAASLQAAQDIESSVLAAQQTASAAAVSAQESANLATQKAAQIEADLESKADKSEIPTLVSQLENDAGYLTSFTETDPTVPAWAKAQTKPSYTAQEVGALPADTVIPTVPTNVSAFTNDAGYLTQHQDISGKADKTDTVLETTLSRGRKENTTAGGASLAFGINTEASGYYSVALGLNTTASSQGAYAEGKGTVAHYIAHAEGEDSQALSSWSHAQNLGTIANGGASSASGRHTIANGADSFVFGKYNAADSYDNWPTWTANTSYKVGDRVKRNLMVQNELTDVGYHCTVANSDATFDIAHWKLDGYHMNYVEIVGNGEEYEDPETHQDVRAGSNAYALEWNGTGHFAGDVYVRANADSSGGIKLATINDLPTSVNNWSGLTYHTSTMSTDSDSFVLGGATDAPTEINKCLVTSTPSANVIPKFDYQGRLHSVTPEEEWDGSNAVATTEYVDNMISDNMPEIPTNVSELNNDAGYLTSYTETDPTVPSWAKAAQKPSYTAAEVGAPTVQEMNTAIGNAIGNINSFDMAVVQELPSSNISTHTIYLVPKTGETNDVYDEYVYINNAWEMVGNTQIDLSNYVQKNQYATSSTPGLVATGNNNATGLNMNNGIISIYPATAGEYKQGITGMRPIGTDKLHLAAFYGLAKAAGDTTQSQSDNEVGTYTTEAKAAIRSMIGAAANADISVQDVQVNGSSILSNGIANIPYTSDNNYGVMKTNPIFGIGSLNGFAMIAAATIDNIKSGSNGNKPIVSLHQHESTFYGLATAAGDTTQSQSDNVVGTYTNEAKLAIQNMLGVVATSDIATLQEVKTYLGII